MTLETQTTADPGLVARFVDALPAPVIVVDRERRIVAINAPARELFPGLAQGAGLTVAIRSPDVLDALARLQKGGIAEQTVLRERVPVERIFTVHVAPLDLGAERFGIVTLDDQTEARRIEKMRTDFIANASHELRTPLASIVGFIETLIGPARDDSIARAKFLVIMREQAERMRRLIDDLLSLSRIEQSEHVRPQDRVDLVDVLHQVVDGLSQIAETEHVAVRIAGLEHAEIFGDRDELLRLAENLVENAIKYGGSGGHVEITLARENMSILLSVQDSGPGIPAEHLPRLTERFYRVDSGQSRAKGGTGLGLALVKHIVHRHRGRLSITSQPGAGATFTATFPAI